MKTVRIVLLLLILTGTLKLVAQQSGPVTLALMDFENMDEVNDYDYMGTLAMALIKEDLTQNRDIVLVDRTRLQNILDEQKMQVSGVIDEASTVEIGKILGCDYLCAGNFIVMDTEVLLDISLTEVETGQVTSFSTRGDSEDLFHMTAEKLVGELTGKKVFYRSSDSAQPILKHIPRDPGTLKFYSHLIDARLYIDGEFYGYTTGDRTAPTIMELPPGEHTIMVDLGADFGVVKGPELRFEKWEESFEIFSRTTLVLEDKSRHFNEWLYNMRTIIEEEADFYDGAPTLYAGDGVPFSFQDQKGRPIEGSLSVNISPGEEEGSVNALVFIEYNSDRKEYYWTCPKGQEIAFKATVGIVELELELDTKYQNHISADWELIRTDIRQGMHRE
ncbi:MAG: CsgG/HfaB family protein [Spirochaetales bacterium]|nr:CsgG/HfaB family protein [Spirochaetales bacterium]